MKVWWLDKKIKSIRLVKFYYENRIVIIKILGNKRVRAKYLFSHYTGARGLTDNIEPEILEEMIPKCQGYFEID